MNLNPNMQPQSIQNEIQTGRKIAWLDVRTPVEYEEERIAGSTLMPLDQLNPQQAGQLSGAADLAVLVCRSGKRAQQAQQRLANAGAGPWVVLEGGLNAWVAAGLPVERSSRKRLPLMRQVQLIIGLLALTGSLLALTVDRQFAWIPLFLGAGLTMAGATGWCGLAILLAKMPWNRVDTPCSTTRSCSLD